MLYKQKQKDVIFFNNQYDWFRIFYQVKQSPLSISELTIK